MVGLAAVNLALFRRDGLDFLLALTVAYAGWCFFAAQSKRLSVAVDRLSMALAVPWWLVLAALMYYVALGAHAHFTAAPVPPHLVRPPPGAEDLADLEEVKRRFPGEKPRDEKIATALKKLEDTRKAVMDSSDDRPEYGPFQGKPRFPGPAKNASITWDSVREDPAFKEAIAVASPYLDEYQEFWMTHHPARATCGPSETYPELSLRQSNRWAEITVIRYLAASPEGAAEARLRFERLIQSNIRQLSGPVDMIPLLIEMTFIENELRFLEAPPDFFSTSESAARQADLLRQLRPLLTSAYQNALRGELETVGQLLEEREFPPFLSNDFRRAAYFPSMCERQASAARQKSSI